MKMYREKRRERTIISHLYSHVYCTRGSPYRLAAKHGCHGHNGHVGCRIIVDVELNIPEVSGIAFMPELAKF